MALNQPSLSLADFLFPSNPPVLKSCIDHKKFKFNRLYGVKTWFSIHKLMLKPPSLIVTTHCFPFAVRSKAMAPKETYGMDMGSETGYLDVCIDQLAREGT